MSTEKVGKQRLRPGSGSTGDLGGDSSLTWRLETISTHPHSITPGLVGLDHELWVGLVHELSHSLFYSYVLFRKFGFN
jgi:hypothetical protein